MRDESPAPPNIPDYELLREIGRGSYGVVWLARGVTGLYRAVKIVWCAAFEDPQPYEREFRGIKEFAAVSLVEPRQLALLHVGRNDEIGFFYYVMELADDAETGREIDPTKYVPYTLRELRGRRGRLSAQETLALAVDLSSALAGLHAHNLVHRDIKPSNVIFVGGVPKLADLGLVTSAARTDVTVSRVGNPGYMPPDMPGTPSADVYGLGKVLYELAMGRNRDEYPRLPADLDTVQDRKTLLELNEIITRACHPNPEKRYTGAAALRDDLLLLHAGKSVRRLRATERHLARALRVTAVFAVTAGIAGIAAWLATLNAREEMRLRAIAETERDLIAQKSVYSATLTRAQRALETQELGLARRLLSTLRPESGRPDLRDFEWYALWQEAQGDLATVAQAQDVIKKITLSPDGRVVATQSGDSSTQLWAADTLKPVGTIPGTRLLAGYSLDGRWLIGTTDDQALQRWDVATGKPAAKPSPGLNFPLQPIAGNGAWGLLRNEQGFALGIRRWSFEENKEELFRPLVTNDAGPWIFQPFPSVRSDGATCVVSIRKHGSGDPEWRLQIYDLAASRLIHDFALSTRITSVALSPDGRFLAAAAADAGSIRLYDLHRNALALTIPGGIGTIESLAFCPENRRLLAGGAASAIRMFAVADGHLEHEFLGHDVGVLALIWSNRDTFYAGDGGGEIRRWVVDQKALETNPRQIAGFLAEEWKDMIAHRPVCVSTDGQAVAAHHKPGVLRIVNMQTGFQGTVGGDFPLEIDVRENRVVVLDALGQLMSHRLGADTRTERNTALFPRTPTLNTAVLSTARNRLVAGAADGGIWIWRYPQLELVAQGQMGPVMWIAISPDGNYVAANGRNNIVRVWSGADGTVLGEFRTGGAQSVALAGAISSATLELALALETGAVEIHDLSNFQKKKQLRTDSSRLYSIEYSPDGRRLFCGGANGVVHVYASDDWRLIVTLDNSAAITTEDRSIVTLAMSANSNRLVGYRADGSIRIWTAAGADTRFAIARSNHFNPLRLHP